MASPRAVFVKIYSHFFAKRILKNSLKQMENTTDIDISRVKLAIEDVLAYNFESSDIDAMEKIENLRTQGLKSKNLRKKAMIGKSGIWAKVLYSLVRQFNPKMCLELGTCLGFSASYQALALTVNHNQGRLFTLDLDVDGIKAAESHFEQLGLSNVDAIPGRFEDTLYPLLTEQGMFDYAFVDGHHDEQATQDYFEQLIPHLNGGAIVIFDDIIWSAGMVRAWQNIVKKKEVAFSLDLFVIGICILRK